MTLEMFFGYVYSIWILRIRIHSKDEFGIFVADIMKKRRTFIMKSSDDV